MRLHWNFAKADKYTNGKRQLVVVGVETTLAACNAKVADEPGGDLAEITWKFYTF